jgi:hypothetical protein
MVDGLFPVPLVVAGGILGGIVGGGVHASTAGSNFTWRGPVCLCGGRCNWFRGLRMQLGEPAGARTQPYGRDRAHGRMCAARSFVRSQPPPATNRMSSISKKPRRSVGSSRRLRRGRLQRDPVTPAAAATAGELERHDVAVGDGLHTGHGSERPAQRVHACHPRGRVADADGSHGNVAMSSVRKPSSCPCSYAKLRSSRPACVSSTIDNATSVTTRPLSWLDLSRRLAYAKA